VTDFQEFLLIGGIIEAHPTGGIHPEHEKFVVEFLVERLLERVKTPEPRAPELIEDIAGEEHEALTPTVVCMAKRIDK
jgi:hypothetical protein